ncbi:MAG TPA: hypothetical protein VFW81_02235, partial [Thermoanaerobaculia bacterium]|nr:hypothetical protein [Thermoanaerobaculia bacterium]
SNDGGRTWEKLPVEFPTVPVWDVKFVPVSHDLVVASHGRGMWIFDDITPLEETGPAIEDKDLHLFTVPPAKLWQIWNRGGFGVGEWVAPNPPPGAIIDYFLKSEIKPTEEQKKLKREPVKITVRDSKGNLVATEYGPGRQGINRYVWQLRYEGPKKIGFGREAPPSEFFDPNRGPDVVPGVYKVTVAAAGKSETGDLQVGPDPRWPADPEALRARAKAALEGRNAASAINEMLNRLDAWETQLTGLPKLVGGGDDGDSVRATKYETALSAARDLNKKVKELKDSVYNRDVQRDTPSDSLHFHNDFQGRVSRLGFLAGAYGEAPREVAREELAAIRKQAEDYLARFNALVTGDVPAYNRAAAEQGVPTLFAGDPIRVEEPAL